MFRRLNNHLQGDVSTNEYIIPTHNLYAQYQNVKIMKRTQKQQQNNIFFYILLTVHLSIILVINRLNAQILVL